MRKVIRNNLRMIVLVARYVPSYLLSSLFYVIFSATANVANVIIIQQVIDLVLQKSPFETVLRTLLIYLIIVLFSNIFIFLHNYYLNQRCRYVYVKRIQHVMFEKSKNIDTECFDNPEFYDLFTRSLKQGDIKGINVFDNLVRGLRFLASMFAVGTFIVLTDPWLILVIGMQCAWSCFFLLKNETINYKADKSIEKFNRCQSYIGRVFYLERFASEIKSTDVDRLLNEKHQEANQNIKKTLHKSRMSVERNNVIDYFFYNLIRNGFVYVYMLYRVMKKFITLGEFTGSINAVMQFTRNFDQFVYFMAQIKQNSLYIDDFLWLMDYQPKIETNKGKILSAGSATLEMKNVSFRYPGSEKNVLENISLIVHPGEKMALVGHNGAGKTTLIKLLLKFYLSDEGEIFINGEPYRDLNEKNLRSHFSAVFQNFQVYSVSVLENVLLRKREKPGDDALAWEALDKAGLKEKIENLPAGLDTILTKEFDDNGLVLSGGERQKLVLARVFASSAPIIIFDEPTSALDPMAEYDINKKIIDLAKEKTVIMISHRLSTIVDAQTIYLLDGGKVLESGNHESLLRMKGKYFKMFETQAQLYRE
jgi:ATP-binding cassette subfamily B protein